MIDNRIKEIVFIFAKEAQSIYGRWNNIIWIMRQRRQYY